jgi:3-hydroxyisobutyrate dehydrogenase-like beta-hydroxyacid dehydrogenase
MHKELKRSPVGVIGLGLMGTALCERLLADGYPLLVNNRTREKAAPLIAAGAVWSENPFLDCDRVVICLYTTDIVEETLERLEDSMRPGTIVIDVTTGDPQRMNLLGERLAVHGVDYLEAPISGSSEQTRRHLSTALVAGPQAAFDACRDVLDCLAAKTYFVGAWGNGIRMKLVTNLVLGLNRAVLAEGLVFAKAVGLSIDDALTVLMNSPAYSRTMDAKGPKMVAGDFSPQAKLAQHLKDVQLILDEAVRGGRMLPLSETHKRLLDRGVEKRLGELDNSSIFCIIDDGWATPSSDLSNGAPASALARG